MWSRIFGRSPVEVPPAALAAHLHAAGLAAEPHFKGDDLGWTSGELRLPGGGTPVYLERFLTTEDDLRDDLNAHAAELETMTHSPHAGDLMRHVIQTQQLITVRSPIDAADEVQLERVVEAVCRFLATAADGVYQTDARGWFAADGELLAQEY